MANLTLRVLSRAGDTTKNAPLTNAEIDQNFINLDADLDLKANIDSPALTGTPTAPTAPGGTNTTQIATTAFVKNAVDTSATAVTNSIGNGQLTITTSGSGIGGSGTFSANQSGNGTITITSNATSSNTPSTIVFRDASGNFSAGTITANLTGNASTASAWQNTRTFTIGNTSKSVNGTSNVSWTLSEIGAVPTTNTLAASTNLNTVVTSGFYRLQNGNTNAPSGVDYGQLIVARGSGDTILQIATGYNTGQIWFRHGNPPDVGGSGSWSPWRPMGGNEDVRIISGNTTAVPCASYILTASLVLTLPASPTAGDWVNIVNRSGTTTPIIARNGQNIMGLAEDMILDNVNATLRLVFADASRGWVWA